MAEPLIRRIETEKKTLDEIAAEVCGDSVKNPRHKIIRMIKLMLGNKYLLENAISLGYHTEKAVRQSTKDDEVLKGKILSEEVEDSNNSGQTNGTPVCLTTLQANTKHEDEAGQTKGQEQALEVHDKPAACCQKRVVRTVRRTDSEKITEEESGETKGQEQVVEELDDAPVVNVSDELVGEIKRLIEKFSLEEVKKALDIAECDI